MPSNNPTNNPTSVSLDVRNFASDGDGWKTVEAANGAIYSYKYTGGNAPENNGDATFSVGGGQAAITLNLVADPRYKFDGDCITFEDDTNNQLSAQGNAPRTRVVNDRCTAKQVASYKAKVTDSTANTTIQCDPRVVNVEPT